MPSSIDENVDEINVVVNDACTSINTNASTCINQHWAKLFERSSTLAQSVFQPGVEVNCIVNHFIYFETC